MIEGGPEEKVSVVGGGLGENQRGGPEKKKVWPREGLEKGQRDQERDAEKAKSV